ncbi:diguanylate cyclase [Vibrio aquaticus]|uniref:diguanylate cyclase n=1 Tax=Vibrio aquaticus TaxID=2496559 RepID=A0A3S0P8G0_9VIBR|nr:GGDEF domain-containing protein [Vibrio aquaticus]RTZ17670.1 diguanylate cyclase [Vibrio aquaticus]
MSRFFKLLSIAIVAFFFLSLYLFRPFSGSEQAPVISEPLEPFEPDTFVAKTDYGRELVELRDLSRSKPKQAMARLSIQHSQLWRLEEPIETAYRYMIMVNVSLHMQNNEKVTYYNQLLLDLAEKENIEWILASALVEQSIEHAKHGEPKLGLEKILKAKEIAKRIRYENLLVKIYNTAGALHNEISDYVSAQNYFHKGIELGKRYPEHIYNSKLLSNMGFLYVQLEEWQQAKRFFDRSLESYLRSNLVENGVPLILYGNLVYVHYRLNEPVEARIAYDNLISYLNDASPTRQKLIATKALAYAEKAEGNLEKALATAMTCTEGSESESFPSEHAQCLLLQAEIALSMGDTEKAVSLGQESQQFFETMGARNWLIAVYRFLSDAYDKQGNATLALDMYKRYYQNEKELLFDRRQSELYLVEEKFANKQLVQERDLLDAQSRLDELSMEKQKLRNRVLLLMSVVCIGLLIFMAYRSIEYVRKNRELSAISTTDPLTGLKNRRYYEQWAKEQADNESLYTLAVVDLDKFKSINDTYGHDVGDDVLVETANRLQAAAPEGSHIIRWGGEEFTCLVPYSSKQKSDLDNIRQAIAGQPIETKFGDIAASITVGAVGPIKAEQLSHNNDLFAEADEALYQGKNEGRNRVIYKQSA